MMRKTVLLAAATLLLTGCAAFDDDYPSERVAQEIDYDFPDEVFFAFNSADLSPHAEQALADLAGDIRDTHPRWTVAVEGHTDTVGSQDYNVPLSQDRAQAVADALVRDGVNPRRVEVRGLGEHRLAVPTGDNVPDRRNRRVVVRLIPPR
ncbi:MAG TPA: OmpA family protein [Rhizomicrobium sp.]|nr:OmpA family protein [Rhizomicrobium sp.]